MNVCGFRLSTEMLSAQGIRFPGLTLPTGVYEPSDYTVKENVELKQKRTLTCQLSFRLRQSFIGVDGRACSAGLCEWTRKKLTTEGIIIAIDQRRVWQTHETLQATSCTPPQSTRASSRGDHEDRARESAHRHTDTKSRSPQQTTHQRVQTC
jgi:hypothetical protein